MKKQTALLLLTLTGCSTALPPSESLIETAPIIQIGNQDSVPEKHIVYIPADTSFPITVSANGDLLRKAISSQHNVSFTQDMYIYKQWASLDGKTWHSITQLLNFPSTTALDRTGGKINIRLDLPK